MPNGEPEFGWRQFETPPIQHEAAAEIERLRTAQPQYLSTCLRAGACHGVCQSTACTNYGKDVAQRIEP
jgi:heterodisulfide reductase subunit C